MDAAIPTIAGNELDPTGVVGPEGEHELRYRAKLAGTAAADMLKNLPKAPGRRAAMLYISDGYVRSPVDPALADLPRTARQLGVTIFTLNPRALRRVAQPAPNSGSPPISASDREAMLTSLRALTESTGGFAVLTEKDFADAFQRIARAMR
jgi:hypothetical protein